MPQAAQCVAAAIVEDLEEGDTLIRMIKLLLLSIVFAGAWKENEVSRENVVKLLASEAGETALVPSSRIYRAVLHNQSKSILR